MSERSDAWVEGSNAYHNGEPEWANRYTVGTNEFMDWNDGYMHAENSDGDDEQET